MSNSLRPIPMAGFVCAALLPLPLLLASVLAGGLWLWLALIYMALFVALADQLLPFVAGEAEEGQEFPGADLLLAVIGISALILLAWLTRVLALPGALSPGQKVILFFAGALWLGQVGHPAAHELIHRSRRPLFRLGQAFYTAILFGQHASAHRLVHHRHVGSAADPNSARENESFYHFWPRAWIGSFREGWRAEDALRARAREGERDRPLLRSPHPYAVYLAGGALALTLAALLGGLWGLFLWIAFAAHVQMQILVSDYVQHYGLRRARLADGRLEPVGPQHSWNSAPWLSSAMMLNATRHSDHHLHPSRPYPALRLGSESAAPRLPWPLPLACAIAFLPSLWRRSMRRRLQPWKARAP